ncbi:hypothetical protein M8818_001284 [Zalaria obscura]|uniref:Uncharacterized protein n=1 Tax=Zalaria obscura TaxID=2024903 RepID=A0ACC3SLM7_9PEZI
MVLIYHKGMSAREELLDRIEADREELIKFLQTFVQAPSPNPPGNTVAAAEVISKFLSKHGLKSETVAPKDDLPNIVSIVQGASTAGPRLVMNGHIDVFPVTDGNDWDHGPWSGDIVNGRIYGRGVVDMKAGTAATVAAFAYVASRREELRGTLVLQAVSDEETGGRWGSRYLLEQDERKDLWRGDCVLNSEPSGLQSIRFGEKGTLRMTFTVRTPGAHGAYLHLSEGAIRVAARLITRLLVIEQIDDFELDPALRSYLKRDKVRHTIDEIMGEGAGANIIRPTVNIGVIRGGSKVNMIPSLCEFETDIRLPIGLTAEAILARIDGILGDFPEASYSVQKAASNPPNSCAPDHPLGRAIADSAEDVLNRRPVAIPSMGATDCKFWRYLGVPAYSFGLSPDGMASKNESVSLDDYISLVKVHALAALDYMTNKRG